ncbi:MAG: response regulator [Alphaproteobacteria bacterium]
MAKAGSRPHGNTTEVLLVEGDPMNRILFRDLLESVADSVYAAADGPQALEVLKIVRPDLIVIDVVDPRPSGLDAVKKLANGAEKKIPVVVVSGLPARVHKQAMMEAGCDAYVAKPVSVATFVNTIRHVLANHRPGRKATSRLAHYLDIGPSRLNRLS